MKKDKIYKFTDDEDNLRHVFNHIVNRKLDDQDDGFAQHWLDEHPEPEKELPNLGLATTRQLLEEIVARAEINGSIDHRTVEGG